MNQPTLPVIPAPDPIGIPAPSGLLQALLVLTFVLHLLPMSLLLGGTLMAAWAEVRGRWRRSQPHLQLARQLAPLLPTVTAYVVTLGVAPLLFVQLLYGQFFYSSSALMGWAWFAVVPLLLLAYAGFYFYFWRGQAARRLAGALLVVSGLAVLIIAYLWVNNSTLMLSPTHWWGIWTSGRTLAVNAGDTTVFPRLLTMLGVACLSASLYVLSLRKKQEAAGRAEAVASRPEAATGEAEPAGGAEARLTGRVAAAWSTMGAVIALAGGLWYSQTLPTPIRAALGKGPAPLLGWLALATILLAEAAVLRAARRNSAGRASAGLASTGLDPVGILGLILAVGAGAVARHLVRQAYLVPYLDPAAWQLRPQWDVFAVFALLLIAGLIFVGYLLLRFTGRLPGQRPGSRRLPARGMNAPSGLS